MTYLVDGSNLLGALGSDRESAERKRALARLLASFARRRNTSVVCFFDGPRPDGFAVSLGSLTIEFSGGASADERIANRAASRRGGETLHVVTSDRALGERLRSRRVEVTDSRAFAATLQGEAADAAPEGQLDDWEAYFSDPRNRNV